MIRVYLVAVFPLFALRGIASIGAKKGLSFVSVNFRKKELFKINIY